jgi:hypothetical protein
MKVMMTIAMFVAILLLVTHMAFATVSCDQEVCYDITKTYEGGPTSDTTWHVCLNDDGTGMLDGQIPLALFGGSLIGTGFDGQPNWTSWIMLDPNDTGHIWTDIFGIYLHGEGYLIPQSMRWKVQGVKVPCALEN